MTGNKIAWRAPLAGLASVAMVATMGVAAGTASAADVTFTFQGNGLLFKGAQTSVTLKDGDSNVSGAVVNGKLDQAELDWAKNQLMNDSANLGKFTNWYTTAEYGQADTAVQPGVASNTTVYAHHADRAVAVNFTDLINGDASIPSSTKLAANNDGTLKDVLSAWQVDTKDHKIDALVLNSFATADGKEIAPDSVAGADLTEYVSWMEGQSQAELGLAAKYADAYTVTFQADGFTADPNFEWAEAGGTAIDVKKGDALQAFPSFTKDDGDGERSSVKNWKDAADPNVSNPDKVSRITAPYTPTKHVTLLASQTDTAYKVTFQAQKSGASADEKFGTFGKDANDNWATREAWVTKDTAATAPATPTKAEDGDALVRYGFDNWYADSDVAADGTPVAGKKPADLSKISGPMTVTATYKVTEKGIVFAAGYDQAAPQVKWFKDGDVFEAPIVTRDGYEFDTWANANDETNKQGSFYNTINGRKLSFQNGEMKALISKNENGTEKTDYSAAITGPFTATWKQDLGATLTQLENKVNVDLTDKAASKLYGLDSYKAYAKAFKEEYLPAKKAAYDSGKAYTKAEYATLIKQLQDLQAKIVEKGTQSLLRVYNPNNGDHYFTTYGTEVVALTQLGWKAEGAPFKVVPARVNNGYAANLGTALYSAYNPNTGEHLLVEAGEAAALQNAGWIWEDASAGDNVMTPKFYTVQNGAKDVYRVYNPNTNGPAHIYTSMGEAQLLANLGWKIDNQGKPVFTLD